MSTVAEEGTRLEDTRAEPADAAWEGRAEGRAEGALEGHHLLELWSDREEVHALPEILRQSEGLVVVGSGTVVRSGRLSQRRWLVVLTDRRLLCIKGRHPATRKVIDMPISAVRSVESKGLWRKTLVFETGYGNLRISGVKSGVAAEMRRGLQAFMDDMGDQGEHATAVRRADLPGHAGSAAPSAATAAEVAALRAAVSELLEEMNELREQIAFLEGMVRANIESPNS